MDDNSFILGLLSYCCLTFHCHESSLHRVFTWFVLMYVFVSTLGCVCFVFSFALYFCWMGSHPWFLFTGFSFYPAWGITSQLQLGLEPHTNVLILAIIYRSHAITAAGVCCTASGDPIIIPSSPYDLLQAITNSRGEDWIKQYKRSRKWHHRFHINKYKV
jgi:hypothetical protein